MEKLNIILKVSLVSLGYILIIMLIVASIIAFDYYIDYKQEQYLKNKPKMVLNGQKITITNNKLTLIGRDTIYELHLEYVK